MIKIVVHPNILNNRKYSTFQSQSLQLLAVYFCKQLGTEPPQFQVIYILVADKKVPLHPRFYCHSGFMCEKNFLSHQVLVYWQPCLSFWHSTVSERTLNESEAELVLILVTVQQKGCSGNKCHRLIDKEIISAPSMELFLPYFLQQLVRRSEREKRSRRRREEPPYDLPLECFVSCCSVLGKHEVSSFEKKTKNKQGIQGYIYCTSTAKGQPVLSTGLE